MSTDPLVEQLGPLLERVQRAIAEGDLEHARRVLEESLDGEFADPNAQLLYAVVTRRLGRPDLALIAAQRALAFAPAWARARDLATGLAAEVRGAARRSATTREDPAARGRRFLGDTVIVELFHRHRDRLESAVFTRLRGDQMDEGICHVDGELLYLLIREFRVRNVIEFSPNRGYSTAFIGLGLRDNGGESVFATFDTHRYEGFDERMADLGLAPRLVIGDALRTVPHYLRERDLTGRVDLCFIDSDHSYGFAAGYARSILPLLGPRCLLAFHDICFNPYLGDAGEGFDHYGPLEAAEVLGTGYAFGEGRFLAEYFGGRADYHLFSTHRLFGDAHDYSSVLPRNDELISRLAAAVQGFVLPPSAGLLGGSPRPPMMLLAIPAEWVAAPPAGWPVGPGW